MAVQPTELENYSREKVTEFEDDKSLHFPDLPNNLIHMKVKAGSRLRNLLGYAIKAFKEDSKRHILFTGSGHAINKAITCTEIMKRKYKNVYQITKISFSRIEEVWQPKISELSQLKVTREIPTIHLLLCKDTLNDKDPGYQAPGSLEQLWANKASEERKQRHRKDKRPYPGQRERNASEKQAMFFRHQPKQKLPKEEIGGTVAEGTKIVD